MSPQRASSPAPSPAGAMQVAPGRPAPAPADCHEDDLLPRPGNRGVEQAAVQVFTGNGVVYFDLHSAQYMAFGRMNAGCLR